MMFTHGDGSAIAGVLGERAPTIKTQRSAFYLESQGQPLFSWLHHRQTAPSFRHGVLLCAPIGYEQVHSHRSWRRLADALAEAGFPVLRFDYHGTGDSAGCDEDADRLSVWLTNIRDAKLWLQQKLGCDKISLIGLRLGASLAMQAAAAEVESLLLWSPVVSGRMYVREMKALSLTATLKAPPLPEAPNDIEAGGFVITKPSADDLSKLDLLKVYPRCRRALIMARDDFPQDRRLLDHLLGLGIQAEQAVQPGYAEMMAEPHLTKVPRQAIAFAVNWFLAGSASEKPSWHKSDGKAEHGPTVWPAQPPMCERLVSIQQDPELFGVLTEPVNDGRAGDLPMILLVNAGSTYRIGPNRLHVLLARRLALQGFRCVRLDLHGLGDSVPAGCEGQNDAYGATAFRDIENALKHLESQLGAKRVVLMGLCSGAYFAFQSAAQLSNPILVESVLINPLTYFWKEGMSLETDPTKEHQVFDYYWKAAQQPSNWLKFLGGRTKTGIGQAIATLVQRWRLRSRCTCDGATERGDHAGAVSHPRREDLRADLGRVQKRGRPIACYFSKADPGFSILNFHAKQKVRDMLAAGELSVSFFEGADHTFSFRAPRRALVEAISAHLCRRFRLSQRA